LPEIKFYYQKSTFHQEIKADGAVGGVAPTGDKIAMSVYTERNPIPQVVVQELSDEGILGAEILDKRESKVGVVRSVQATIHMDVPQARAIYEWIGRQLQEIEKLGSKQ
jgi:hypothetical protein